MDINIPKPSKKIVAMIIITLGVLLTVIIYKYKLTFFEPKTAEINTVDLKTKAPETITTIDADKDGLPDWEEALWGSDPKNSDTDKDGTNDGTEIKLKRDPVITGPNDSLTKIEEKNVKTSIKESYSGPKTISESLVQDFFAKFMYLKSNNSLTEENQKTLVNNFIEQSADAFSYKKYSASGITYTVDQNQNSKRTYGSIFANLQVDMIISMQQNFSLIEKSMKITSAVYAKQASDLYAMRIPKDIAETHLNIVNNFSKVAESFTAFANEKIDPVKSALALKLYQSAYIEINSQLKLIAQYLKDNGIIYTNEEIGGYWNNFDTI